MADELEKAGIGKLEVRQLDPIEPEIIPYEGGSIKLMYYKGGTYKSTGFQIIEKDGDRSIIIRETFYKRFNERETNKTVEK